MFRIEWDFWVNGTHTHPKVKKKFKGKNEKKEIIKLVQREAT